MSLMAATPVQVGSLVLPHDFSHAIFLRLECFHVRRVERFLKKAFDPETMGQHFDEVDEKDVRIRQRKTPTMRQSLAAELKKSV
jgi:hypothetical protein